MVAPAAARGDEDHRRPARRGSAPGQREGPAPAPRRRPLPLPGLRDVRRLACPEEEVLDLVHGQAVVVNGVALPWASRPVPRECPVGAITVTLHRTWPSAGTFPTLGGRASRRSTTRGLFLAGEVTAHALIKTADRSGDGRRRKRSARRMSVDPAQEGKDRMRSTSWWSEPGPPGLACSLEAKRVGLHFLDARPGGRASGGDRGEAIRASKLVTTQPDRPADPRASLKRPRRTRRRSSCRDRGTATVASDARPAACAGGRRSTSISSRTSDGDFVVHTSGRTRATYRARHVCLALGRRGAAAQARCAGRGAEQGRLLPARRALAPGSEDAGRRRRRQRRRGGPRAVRAARQPGHAVLPASDDFFRISHSQRARTWLRAAQGDRRMHGPVLRSERGPSIGPEAVDLRDARTPQWDR